MYNIVKGYSYVVIMQQFFLGLQCSKYAHKRVCRSMDKMPFLSPLHNNIEVTTPSGNCSNGEVRLVGGTNDTNGRVEVCINNAWGTVCNRRFGYNDARVICSQLGFSNTGMEQIFSHQPKISTVLSTFAEARPYSSTASIFGSTSGPIFLENLRCDGTEVGILDCPQSIHSFHQCGHDRDAGVQCYGIENILNILCVT